MSANINVVIQSGYIKWPALRYGPDGKPEFRFSLTRPYQKATGETGESGYPCCAIGPTAEKLAADLDEGMFIVITAGELVYRKRQTKQGEVSRLEILVWRVQMDNTSLPTGAVAAQSDPGTTPEPSEPENDRRERKPRRRACPKQALEGGFAVNPN